MHNSSDAPFGRRVLWAARAVEEGCAGAYEGEARVLLRRRGAVGAVLADEGVVGEFGCVEDAVEVDLDGFEVWRFDRVVRAWQSKALIRG